MRTALALAALAFVAGCATNPLLDARFWKIEQCAGSGTPAVRFLGRNGTSTLATIPRASCNAVASAENKIERLTGYRANQLFVADPDALNAFATIDKENCPIIVVTLGMAKALGNDEDAWAGLLGHEIAHHVRNHGAGRKDAQEGSQVCGRSENAFAPGNCPLRLCVRLMGTIAAR